jgi:hypothetical protein
LRDPTHLDHKLLLWYIYRQAIEPDRNVKEDAMAQGFREQVIVVVNGYNVQRPDWEFVVSGDLQNGRLGRIPKALYIGLCERADYMLWDTGGSRKKWADGEELSEAEYSHRYALAHIRDWMNAFPDYFNDFSFSEVSAFLNNPRRHRFEFVSKNTLSAAYEAVPIIDELVGEQPLHVISVSSRNHTRAGHHFQMVLAEGYNGHGPLMSRALRVSHECADTGYHNDGGMPQVQIFECTEVDQYRIKSL